MKKLRKYKWNKCNKLPNQETHLQILALLAYLHAISYIVSNMVQINHWIWVSQIKRNNGIQIHFYVKTWSIVLSIMVRFWFTWPMKMLRQSNWHLQDDSGLFWEIRILEKKNWQSEVIPSQAKVWVGG